VEDSGDIKTLHADTVAFAHEVGEQDPVVLRQAKRASRITHHHGHHYVLPRMEELLDEFLKMQHSGI
jgi:hypothetical protein